MRKNALLLALLLTPLLSTAQEQPHERRYAAGIKVGGGITTLFFQSNDTIKGTSGVAGGYQIIVDLIDYRLSEKLKVSLGTGFTHYSYLQKTAGVALEDLPISSETTENLTLQNIEIPLQFKYKIGQNDLFNSFLCLGTALHFNLHRSSYQRFSYLDGTIIRLNQSLNFTKISFAGQVGVEWIFNTSHRFRWLLASNLQMNPSRIGFLYGKEAKALLSLNLMGGIRF